jgi:hypothetical protein
MLGSNHPDDFFINARPPAQAGKVELFHPVALADVVNQVIRLAAFAYKRHLATLRFQSPAVEIPPQFQLPHHPSQLSSAL